MDEFDFPMRVSLKKAWHIFTKHAWVFIALAVVMILLSFISKPSIPLILRAISSLASLVVGYVGLSLSLAAVDGKDDRVTFSALASHLPTFMQFLKLLGVGLLTMLIVGAGLIALVIPGVYFLIRLLFSNFALVDRKEGVIASMKYSWRMVKGDVFWTVFLAFVITALVIFIGLLVLGVGVVISYPVGVIFLALLYRSLATHHEKVSAVIVQPQEIKAT